MATPIKRIEKDFFLKVLYDENIPLKYYRNRLEYVLVVERPATAELYLKADRPVAGLKPKRKIELRFDYKGRKVSFSAEIISVQDDRIITKAPEYLYKDLDRSYSRVSLPPDLRILLLFLGERYSLAYPKITEFEPGKSLVELMKVVDPKNFSGLIAQMAVWIKGFADGYRLVIFKDVKPTTAEERLLAETGKTLYLPSTMGTFPVDDPFPKKRLITEDIFRYYLIGEGVPPSQLDEKISRFVSSKFDTGVFSDAWVPILFQEYVVGYIHLWINKKGRTPFSYDTIDTLYQFAEVLAFSLKENGYFDEGRIKNEPFQGDIIDISVSGILFAYPHSPMAASLLPNSELSVMIITPNRRISASARVVRRYTDKTLSYFGCRFLEMAPEDTRFIFEFIYGKPFNDSDASFLIGQV
jgi:hypothetical protein